MSVKAISRVKSGGSGFSGQGADNSREIESLNRERERLKQEMSEIRSDMGMDSSEKRLKMQSISTKISTISGKIQSLVQTCESGYVQKNADNGDKREELIKEKVKLQQEIAQIRSSDSMDEQEKHTKVMKIMMEINSIQNQVRNLTGEDVTAMQFPPIEAQDKTQERAQLEEKLDLFIGTGKEDKQQKELLDNKINILA